MSQTTEEELKLLEYQVSLSTQILHYELRDVWGHVSARLPGGEGFLIKYLRHSDKETDDPDEVSLFSFDGRQLRGTRTPPMELVIHVEMYKQRPDVGSIIHAHPQTVIALSVAGMKILPIHQQSAIFSPEVPMYPHPHWITDAEQMREVIAVMGENPAVSLRGHGAITASSNVIQATAAMVYLEKTAVMQATAAAIGNVTPLPMDVQQHGTHRKGNGGSLPLWRAWEEQLRTGRFW